MPKYKSDNVDCSVGLEFHGASNIRENGNKKITDHNVVDVVTFSFPLVFNFKVMTIFSYFSGLFIAEFTLQFLLHY